MRLGEEATTLATQATVVTQSLCDQGAVLSLRRPQGGSCAAASMEQSVTGGEGLIPPVVAPPPDNGDRWAKFLKAHFGPAEDCATPKQLRRRKAAHELCKEVAQNETDPDRLRYKAFVAYFGPPNVEDATQQQLRRRKAALNELAETEDARPQPIVLQEERLGELTVFAHALLVTTARKLHDKGTPERTAAEKVAQERAVQTKLTSKAFAETRLGEANYSLFTSSLLLLSKALPLAPAARLRMGMVKCILCPQGRVLEDWELAYKSACRQNGWEQHLWDGEVQAEALLTACAVIKHDTKHALMRQHFFEAEMRRQATAPGPLPTNRGAVQKALFCNLYYQLCASGAFGKAVGQLEEGMSARTVLEETLLISIPFYQMLLARDCKLLLTSFPDDAVDKELLVVGGGAKDVVMACAGVETAERLLDGLHAVHEAVTNNLDPDLVKGVCPLGWCVSNTEKLCCLLRIYEERRKKRDVLGAAQRQVIRRQLMHSGPAGGEVWRLRSAADDALEWGRCYGG